jgi:putative endonuclease
VRSRLDRFRHEPHPHGRGRSAERDAARWLARQGFVVVAVNAATRAGEIDLVAREGDVLCFVEVKARSSDAYGPALAAVGPAKRRRLARAASLWLARHPYDGPCRFDVLALDAVPAGRSPDGAPEASAAAPDDWTYTLVRNAFEAS